MRCLLHFYWFIFTLHVTIYMYIYIYILYISLHRRFYLELKKSEKSRSFIMYSGLRYNLHQMLIALMCISSATEQTSLPCNLTNVCNKSNNSNNTEPPEKQWRFLSEEEMEKISMVTMSVSAMSGLLNFLVIVAIVIDPLKKLRKGPWITILNLATADLISSVSFICLWGDRFFTAIEQRKLYYAIIDFGWIFGASGSFLWLTMFTVQIFVLTKSPLKGRYWFTTKKKALVGIVIWICAFLLGLTNMSWYYFPRLVSLKFFIGQIAVLQIAVFIQIILNIQVAITILRAAGSVGNVENNKHNNIAKTVIILTLILFVSAFPYFLFKQMEFLARLGYFGQSKTSLILNGLAYCYTPIATVNFLANPILYSLRLPDYRKTLLAFIRGKKYRRTLRRSSSQFSTSRQTITSTARSQRMSSTSM